MQKELLVCVSLLPSLICGPARSDRQPAPAQAAYPEARGFAQLVYHPPSGRIILLGGESPRRTAQEDTWQYDVATNMWHEIRTEPHPVDVDGRTAAWDSESDRIIVHYTTRLDRNGPRGLRRISQTWAFDVTSGTWQDMRPEPAPFGLMGARMVYDAAADRMILFGGADFTQDPSPYFNETWAYDYNTNTWTKRNPPNPPPGRSYFGMTYDAQARRVLLYGGSLAVADSAARGEMWAYDYAADRWEKIEYGGNGAPDHHPAMAYAPRLNLSFYLVNQSFRSFDYASRRWTELPFEPSLGVRHFAAMAFDDRTGRLVVFGGGPRGLRYDNQTWVYDPSVKRWERTGPAH